ncbi:hypothetical protein PoB_007590800 [Plakobranchus ocellatus]|uniref:Uncharacterized protein n=1 Tax=Plakobranchus ocellatus TaxID=259542 RepID=A0AAV4DZ85_9GAST|nr:hypothetical protein PoB_007590800 [Plakobranchus ocellatus]
MVMALKTNGSVRMCINLTALNKDARREIHPRNTPLVPLLALPRVGKATPTNPKIPPQTCALHPRRHPYAQEQPKCRGCSLQCIVKSTKRKELGLFRRSPGYGRTNLHLLASYSSPNSWNN